jgi:hypothetical protein
MSALGRNVLQNSLLRCERAIIGARSRITGFEALDAVGDTIHHSHKPLQYTS